jgi:hypothetical protein
MPLVNEEQAKKDAISIAQMEQQLNANRAREVTGSLPDGRMCVIQQGNVFSVDDLWDCSINPMQMSVLPSLHWAAPSLGELVATGRTRYDINILQIAQG